MNTIELKNYNQFYSYIINMDDISNHQELYVYKIMPFKYFKTLIKDKNLYFCNVNKWEDPYELIMFKQEYHEKGKKLNLCEVKARFYGQSWSYNRDSDALWRIYSDIRSLDSTGVRIKTSVQKIYNLFFEDSTPKDFIPYIGNVCYMQKKGVMEWIKTEAQKNLVERTTESLFIKRNNFGHEDEFRIILQVPSVDNDNRIIPCPDAIKIPIDINDFIYEVAFDPRLDDDTYEFLSFFTRKYMTPGKRIMRSTLYKTNKPLKIKLKQ